jgi:glycosyltransferase involved in cell wall biosynthesis
MKPRFTIPTLKQIQASNEQLPWRFGGGLRGAGRNDVSVVVPTFNAATTLSRTLDSLREQSVGAVEVIVADGGSNDDTVGIIESFSDVVTKFVSAPDAGISDAFNRGIAAARGGYIKLLNADDHLEPDFLRKARQCLLGAPDAAWVYGGVRRFHADGTGCDVLYPREHLRLREIRSAMDAPHPSWVVRIDAYEQLGLYATNLTLAMDYEWLLRAVSRGVHGAACPHLFAEMQRGGRADTNRRQGTYEKYLVDLAYDGLSPVHATALFVWRRARLRKRAAADWLRSHRGVVQ